VASNGGLDGGGTQSVVKGDGEMDVLMDGRVVMKVSPPLMSIDDFP
jgi:hypothetical protein